ASSLVDTPYERTGPAVWPERPAMSASELLALGDCSPGYELLIPAQFLLTPYRFDIPAKYLYAKHRAKKVACAFFTRLYEEHLRVWNGLHEIEPVKHGLRNYLEVFHEMLDSIGATGFDRSKSVIPVGRSLSPINGGHRVAAGLL